jgi:hypothetical protein
MGCVPLECFEVADVVVLFVNTIRQDHEHAVRTEIRHHAPKPWSYAQRRPESVHGDHFFFGAVMQIDLHRSGYADKDLPKALVGMIASADSRPSPMNPVYTANDKRQRIAELSYREPSANVTLIGQLDAISQHGH